MESLQIKSNKKVDKKIVLHSIIAFMINQSLKSSIKQILCALEDESWKLWKLVQVDVSGMLQKLQSIYSNFIFSKRNVSS